MTRSSRKKNRVKLLTWFKNSQEKSFYFEKVSKTLLFLLSDMNITNHESEKKLLIYLIIDNTKNFIS